MNQIRTENSFYTPPSIAHSSSDTDVLVEEWRLTRLDLMLRFKKEFNTDYEEAEECLKENENFDIEKDIGFIDEYPLSIDYIEPNVNDTPPYWLYLISSGGPGSEIRFFVDDKSSTKPYKVEFWLLEWSNNRKQDVTGETAIEQLWEQALLPLTEQMEIQIKSAASSIDKGLFRKQVQHKLDEIRQEAEAASALNKNIDPIPNSAYSDTLVLLGILCDYKLPVPEVGWAEDGSFSIGWYLDEGIITMGIYGDNLVIYTAFFEEKRQFEGICALSDTPMLSGFLKMLTNILAS